MFLWAILLIGFIVALFISPIFRKVSIIIVVVLGIGVFAYIANDKLQKEASKKLVRKDQLEFIDWKLTLKSYNSASGIVRELTGRVKNNSAYTVNYITLSIQALDCKNELPDMPDEFADVPIVREDGSKSTKEELDAIIAKYKASQEPKLINEESRQKITHCEIVDERDTTILSNSIPPGQIRDIQESIHFNDAMRIHGEFGWRYEIKKMEGQKEV
jgi:hypothetical protein